MTTITERATTETGIPLLLVYEEEGTPGPAVIVLHGTRRSKEVGVKEHDRYLAGSGLVRVYPDAPLHGERQPPGSPLALDATWDAYARGERDALREVMIPVVWGLAGEVSEIIDYLCTRPEVVRPRFATYGFSVGGLMSLLAASLEPRLAAAVTLCAPVRFRFMSVGMHYRWHNDSIAEDLAYDPLVRADRFFPTALLMVHGVRDDVVPVEAARAAYAQLAPHYAADSGRLRLAEYPQVRHYLDKPAPYSTPEAESEIVALREEATAWLGRFVGGGCPT